MSDLARVAPAPAAKKKTRPRTRSKKHNAPPHPQQKKNAPPPPPPPPFPPHPPGHLFCNFLPNPAPNAPPPLNCASAFKALNPSQGHHASIVFANCGGRAAPRPTPPPSSKPCQLASQHMNPVQAYHASIGFANGVGCAPPPPTPLLLKAMPACFKANESFPNPSLEHSPPRLKGGGGCAFYPGKLASIIRVPSKPMMMRALCLQMGGPPAPPPTPALFLPASLLQSLRIPSKPMMRALCFQMRRSAQPPTPLRKKEYMLAFLRKFRPYSER